MGYATFEIWKWLLGNWFVMMRAWFGNVHYLLSDIRYDFHELYQWVVMYYEPLTVRISIGTTCGNNDLVATRKEKIIPQTGIILKYHGRNHKSESDVIFWTSCVLSKAHNTETHKNCHSIAIFNSDLLHGTVHHPTQFQTHNWNP